MPPEASGSMQHYRLSKDVNPSLLCGTSQLRKGSCACSTKLVQQHVIWAILAVSSQA